MDIDMERKICFDHGYEEATEDQRKNVFPLVQKKNFNGEFNIKIKKCHLSNTKSMVRPFGHRTDSRTIVSLTTKIMIMMMMMMMMAVVVVVGVIMLIMITNL